MAWPQQSWNVPSAPYAGLPYPTQNMTPEAQLALQQNWQQWQIYHQQYAQWHAQYGEQYAREMQASQIPLHSQPPPPPVDNPPQPPPPTGVPPPPPINVPPPPPPEPESDSSAANGTSLNTSNQGNWNQFQGSNEQREYKNESSGFQIQSSGFQNQKGGYQNNFQSQQSGYQKQQGGFQNRQSGNQNQSIGNSNQVGGNSNQASGNSNQASVFQNPSSGNQNKSSGYMNQTSVYINQNSSDWTQNQSKDDSFYHTDNSQNNSWSNDEEGNDYQESRNNNSQGWERNRFKDNRQRKDNSRNNSFNDSNNDDGGWNSNRSGRGGIGNRNDNIQGNWNRGNNSGKIPSLFDVPIERPSDSPDPDDYYDNQNEDTAHNYQNQSSSNSQGLQNQKYQNQDEQDFNQEVRNTQRNFPPNNSNFNIPPPNKQSGNNQLSAATLDPHMNVSDVRDEDLPFEEPTREEKIFDEQFKAWEDEFRKWKELNADHPDRTSYHEYEMKFEDCRRKLVERREQMAKRKLERRRILWQQQNPSKNVSDDIAPKNLIVQNQHPTSGVANQFGVPPPPSPSSNTQIQTAITNQKSNQSLPLGKNVETIDKFIGPVVPTDIINIKNTNSDVLETEVLIEKDEIKDDIETIEMEDNFEEAEEESLNKQGLSIFGRSTSSSGGGIPGLDLVDEGESMSDNEEQNKTEISKHNEEKNNIKPKEFPITSDMEPCTQPISKLKATERKNEVTEVNVSILH